MSQTDACTARFLQCLESVPPIKCEHVSSRYALIYLSGPGCQSIDFQLALPGQCASWQTDVKYTRLSGNDFALLPDTDSHRNYSVVK